MLRSIVSRKVFGLVGFVDGVGWACCGDGTCFNVPEEYCARDFYDGVKCEDATECVFSPEPTEVPPNTTYEGWVFVLLS